MRNIKEVSTSMQRLSRDYLLRLIKYDPTLERKKSQFQLIFDSPAVSISRMVKNLRKRSIIQGGYYSAIPYPLKFIGTQASTIRRSIKIVDMINSSYHMIERYRYSYIQNMYKEYNFTKPYNLYDRSIKG